MESTGSELTIVSQKRFPIPRDFASGIELLAHDLQELAAGYNIVGVGGGFPGLVEPITGTIVAIDNLPEWAGHPIKQRLSELTGWPVFLYHDVAAAAAGEAYHGQGRTKDDFVFLIWGTGFGGARVEKLLGRLHLTSFEAGHYNADPQGEKCSCGHIGCPELWIGGGNLSKRLGKNLAEVPDTDPVWDTVVTIAARNVANVHAFHPSPLMVFGGGMVVNRPMLFDRVKQLSQQYAFVLRQPELVMSQLGDDAALYGAVVLQQVERV
jgi:glucokinase